MKKLLFLVFIGCGALALATGVALHHGNAWLWVAMYGLGVYCILSAMAIAAKDMPL